MTAWDALLIICARDSGREAARSSPAEGQEIDVGEHLSGDWRPLKGPELQREVTFAPPRKWRFDFAFEKNCTIEDLDHELLPARIAIELENGIWTGGRHVRAARDSGPISKKLDGNDAWLARVPVVRRNADATLHRTDY